MKVVEENKISKNLVFKYGLEIDYIRFAVHYYADYKIKIKIFNMIPKIIHSCWLSGDPFPEDIQRCIDSWKAILPEYKIILWDKNRFDINSVPYVKEAFEAKKYAFCADYIRIYALYKYGGIYLDSDVMVYKSFDPFLNLHAFASMSPL